VYHGTQDDKITSFNSERLYRRLVDDLGGGEQEVGEFFRLFRIGGMAHCHSGPGAWAIGQGGRLGDVDPAPKETGFEPDRNVLAALMEWVERGRRPEEIEGMGLVEDEVGKEVLRMRKHCR
jgi:hypothetical protein